MKEKGQGLVEFALILPFLFVLVVGIVEMGVILNRQITVVNAAREGARFGVYDATHDDVYAQTLLATSQMFEFTADNAVVAVIHAETNEDGTGFLPGTEGWDPVTYPVTATIPHVTPDEVLEQLNEEGDAADLKLVVVDVRYDHESMLGLPFVGALADQVSIGSWTVMRIHSPRKESGCCALPITFPAEDLEGLSIGDELVDIRFGWLFWDPDNNGIAVNLEANLRNRCNAGQKFEDACDGSRELTSGSWVSGVTVADVGDEVEALVGGYYPIPVYDQFERCNPNVCGCKSGTKVVHIVGFALMEITEVKLTGNPKTISAKFRGWYEGCN